MGAFDFDVIDFEPASAPAPGDRVPDFTRPYVTDEGWRDVALSGLAEDSLLLIFYPMNGSGKSLYTWKAARERGWTDAATVAGVSISQPFDQMRFVEEQELDCGIFSDPANGVAEKYGIVHDVGGMAGISEPRPAAFLVDGELTVERAWVADEWPEQLPYDRIDGWLDQLANS